MGNPRFQGTHSSSTTDMAPVAPFAGVTLSDPGTPNPSERITINLSGQGGTVSDGAGYAGPDTLQYTYIPDDPRDSFYSLEGPLAQVTQELDALTFVPKAGQVGTTTATALLLMDLSSSGSTSGFSPDSGTVVYNTTTTDEILLSPRVAYENGVFTLAGHASTAAGIGSVEISADVDGVQTDLGAAAVDANGTFTFADRIGAHAQTSITATATSGAGAGAADIGLFSLAGGLGPGGRYGVEKGFSATEEVSTAVFRPNGQRFLSVEAAGQTVDLGYDDVVANHRQGGTDFVFSPGNGLDVVGGFKLRGADHDTLLLPSADFQSLAAVLRDTADAQGGAVVTDPRTGDAVQLVGLSKAELKAHPGDLGLV